MHKLLPALLISLLLLPSNPSNAAETSDVTSIKSPLDHASWLTGRWIGTGMGGTVEEMWSPQSGGQIVGHFRYSKDDKVVFYEMLLIDLVDDGLRMRVKHFNPDFTGWEEKDKWIEFSPDSTSPRQLKFKGLVLDYDGETMVATVTMRQADGTIQDVPFTFTRAD